ncbi:1-acyl-sn-glycerol-3-phosphate acyltransferase [Candidatus Bipolaricaulota bacterium]|nr:1-acyl-sn-glycerol-3-phosphate acyltransferase [Candidatus Bipolaricaulota bacterium]
MNPRGGRRLARRIGALLGALPYEAVWCVYFLAAVLLPLVVPSRAVGRPPRGPCLFCVTHVGSFDPLFVVRHSGRWRARALFLVDERHPWLRFFYQAFFRFRVTRDPREKDSLNARTLAAAVRYLKGGGSVMVFPEGYLYWAGRLYPGVAKLAHRSGAPIVPVLLGNAYVYRPGAEEDPLGRMFVRILRETRRLGGVVVRFAPPILPDPSRPEGEDVDRMMREVERVFGEFYRDAYARPGPRWIAPPRERA